MAIDTPATIAIIGAGPLGLEAGLYARYLGYEARLFERGVVASGVADLGDTPLLAPFAACASKLGLAALHAQDPRWRPPSPDAVLTAAAWRDAYLLPLAQSDLLVDAVSEHCEVLSVRQTSAGAKSGDALDAIAPRDDDPPLAPNFELQLRFSRGEASQAVCAAHIVIDASGPCGLRLCFVDLLPLNAIPISPAATPLTRRTSHFYLLGAAGALSEQPAVTFAKGLEQIRALFGIVGGRESLDLYATMDKLLP